MRNLIIITIILASMGVIYGQSLTKEEAVDYQVNNFPEAQLCDLYKSFYQDAFGPGHILEDTLASRRYFESELSDTSKWMGPDYEFTGTGKNFVRLNMDLVRRGIIPAEVYFMAFVSSMDRVKKPEAEEWIGEWMRVDSIVKSKGYSFPNEKEDRALIEEKLINRKFTIHHSRQYDSIYNFHYRIISLPQFETLKLNYNF